MPYPDPSDRVLRGELAAAVRLGRPDLELELRHELAIRNIERSIAKHLDGRQLTSIELRRLRRALEPYGPRRELATPAPEDNAVAV